jgi:WD40 repeat protein
VDDPHYRTEGTFLFFDAQSGKELRRFVADRVEYTREQFHKATELPFPEWCVAPDGKLIAKVEPSTLGGTTKLQVQELPTGKAVFAIEDRNCHFRFPQFSPDAKYVGVIAGQYLDRWKGGKFESETAVKRDKTPAEIRLWDLRGAKPVRAFRASKEAFQPYWFTFSPDGAYLAATGRGQGKTGIVYVWDVAGRKPAWRLGGQPNQEESATPFAFSPDSKTLAAIRSGKIYLLEIATGKQVKEVANYPGPCAILDFSDDGKRLIACKPHDINARGPRRMQMWDIDGGKEIDLPVQRPLGYLFARGAKTLIVADQTDVQINNAGGSILLCDGETGKVRQRIPVAMRYWDLMRGFYRQRQGMGWPFAISPNGETVAFADAPGQVRRFEVSTGNEILPSGFASLVADALAFSPDGKTLLAAGTSRVLLHDREGKQPPIALPLNSLPHTELRDQEPPRPATGNRYWPNAPPLTFTGDGKRAAAGFADGSVATWDTSNISHGKLLWQARAHKAPIYSMVFASDDRTLVTSDLDGRIIWWNAETGQIRRELALAAKRRQPYESFPFRFAPGARAVFGLSGQGAALEEWELASGKLRRQLRVQPYPVDFSLDGRTMLVIGENAYHSVDLVSGRALRSFAWAEYPQPESNPYGWCRFSPDGRIVAGIVSDKIIRLWNSHNASLLRSLTGHEGGFRTLTFSPDGRALATAGGDGTILLWTVPRPLPPIESPERITPNEMLALWQKLTGEDAAAAGLALHRLAAAAGVTEWLSGRLAAQMPADEVKRLRIIELLERIGTREARALLEKFADGPPAAWVTRSARAGLFAVTADAKERATVPARVKDADGTMLPNGVITRLGSQRFQDGANVVALRYLPDGKSMVATTSTMESPWESTIGLSLWNAATGRLQHQTEVMDEEMFRPGKLGDPTPCWTLSPDGKLLASSNLYLIKGTSRSYSPLVVKEVATGRVQLEVRDQINSIGFLQFSTTGKKLVAAGPFGGTARLFDLSTGKEEHFELNAGDRFYPVKVQYSPDEQRLLFLGYAGQNELELYIWHFGRGMAVRFPFPPFDAKERSHRQRAMGSIVFAPDSKHVALVSAASKDKKPRLLLAAVEPAQIVRDFGEHPEPPEILFFSPEGKQLVSLSNKKLQRWEVATGKQLPTVDCAADSFIRFAPDGRTLGLVDGKYLCLHDAASGRELHRVPLDATHNGRARWGEEYLHGVDSPIDFSSDSKTIAAAHGRTIRQWDVTTGKEVGPTPLLETIHAVAVANNARFVAACSSRQIRVWDAVRGKLTLSVPTWRNADKKDVALTAVALSPDGRRLAAGGTDGTVALFEVHAAKRLGRHRVHGAAVTSLMFLEDSSTLVSADIEFGVALWDAASGAHLRNVTLPLRTGKATPEWMGAGPDGWHELFAGPDFFLARRLGPVLSPDGRQLVVPSQKSLGLFELASSKPRLPKCPRPHEGKFAISHDGRLLVVGPNWDESYYMERDSPLHLIDVPTGLEARVVANFPKIRDFGISPNGKLLAACGPEGLRIWDTATGTLRASFNAHRGVVTTVAFSPDGNMLVSAAHDGTVLVWDVHTLLDRPGKDGLSQDDLRILWKDLASPDTAAAGKALWRLASHPQHAVALLQQKLKPATVAKEEIARLIADLADGQFKTRETAANELAQLAEIAEPALRALLTAKPALEQRLRAEKLLERLRAPIADGWKLRALRAVEILAMAGTPEAIRVLRTLARGAEGAYVTVEARAALRRIMERGSP